MNLFCFEKNLNVSCILKKISVGFSVLVLDAIPPSSHVFPEGSVFILDLDLAKEDLCAFLKRIESVQDKTLVLVYSSASELNKIQEAQLCSCPFHCVSLSQIENRQFQFLIPSGKKETAALSVPVHSSSDLHWQLLREILEEKISGKNVSPALLLNWISFFLQCKRTALFKQKDRHFEWVGGSGLSPSLQALFMKSFFDSNSPLCKQLLSQPCAALPQVVPDLHGTSQEISDLLVLLHMGGVFLLENESAPYLLFFSPRQTGVPFSWNEIQTLGNMASYFLTSLSGQKASPDPEASFHSFETASLYEKVSPGTAPVFSPAPEGSVKESFSAASLRTFASRTSNEFKNALVSIKTFAQLLPERYKDPRFRKDFFKVMTGEVGRLEKLMDTISFFASDCILRTSSLDLVPLIEETYEILRTHFPQIKLKLNPPDQSFFITADEKLLKNSLLQLLTNSAQAMKESGTVEINLQSLASPVNRLQGLVQITVKDSGPGLDPASKEKWFEPFFSTKASGLGLGLAYAKGVVEAHGGTIRLANRKEGGALVSVELPVQKNPVSNFEALIKTNSQGN